MKLQFTDQLRFKISASNKEKLNFGVTQSIKACDRFAILVLAVCIQTAISIGNLHHLTKSVIR